MGDEPPIRQEILDLINQALELIRTDSKSNSEKAVAIEAESGPNNMGSPAYELRLKARALDRLATGIQDDITQATSDIEGAHTHAESRRAGGAERNEQ